MYSSDLICDIIIFINNNINNPKKKKKISNYVFYNRFYIMKKFKSELKITIFDYINSQKIYNSLNKYNKYTSILSIALLSGFNSIEYYSETFNKVMKISPIKYKHFATNQYINLTEEEIKTINQSTTKLYNIKQNINTYLKKRKPKCFPTKKKSLFT